MKKKVGNWPVLFFLYKTTLKNRVKKALRKPVTYLYLVFAIAYMALIFGSFGTIFNGMDDGKAASTLTALLTVFTFFMIPANLISYCKRKGLIFRQSDIHFLFPAPVGPKNVLLYAHVRTVLMALILNIVLTIGGVLWFHMPVWKMLVYLLLSCVVDNIMEASMMVLCYGNEKLGPKQMGMFRLLLYAVLGVFVLIGVMLYVREGAGLGVVADYLHSSAIQMVPFIGWYIALLHLLFMGPTVWNVAGAALYLVTVIVLLILAVRMKCIGAYYEDAIKFADDYEEARQRGKKGEMAVVGWKKKYKKASVHYKGSYAKALFYRQFLEYKKNRFFIFGFYTLVCLIVGIGLAVIAYRGELGEMAPFTVLGVMAYLTFIFAGYSGKWGKELTRPYTYLIPDSAFHKLWYATLMEHIRALADGCLLVLPTAFVLRIPIVQTVLIIAVYICLQACKLYAEVMLEALLGNILGSVGKQFARMFFEGLIIAFGALGAVVGTLLVSLEVGLLALIVVVALLTVVMMLVASLNFKRMESVA